MLTEKYVQQYIKECILKPDIDLGSEDDIIIFSWYTPMTRKACRRPKQKVKTEPLNLKSLQNTETKRALANAVKNHLQNYSVESQSPAET